MASDSDPGLAHALAKVAAWQAVVDSYRTALALEQSGDLEEGNGRRAGVAVELPIGAFRGMKIPDAIKLLLQSARRKQTVREIATGLREGGMETTSKNFETTVTGALHRLKGDGELLRFKDGWDLAEAHSAALRNRLSKEDKPSKKKSKPTARATSSKKTKGPKASAPKGPTIDQRVEAFLRTRPLEWFTPKQVTEALKETNARVVGMAFARLVRFSKIAKQDDGRYAAIRKA